MTKKYDENCSVQIILKLLGGKWKTLIVFKLLPGTKRFNELKREIPNVTQRMLTNQLRELESDGIVNRKVYAEVPPKVEYSLTQYGHGLKPILEELQRWGAHYLEQKGH